MLKKNHKSRNTSCKNTNGQIPSFLPKSVWCKISVSPWGNELFTLWWSLVPLFLISFFTTTITPPHHTITTPCYLSFKIIDLIIPPSVWLLSASVYFILFWFFPPLTPFTKKSKTREFSELFCRKQDLVLRQRLWSFQVALSSCWFSHTFKEQLNKLFQAPRSFLFILQSNPIGFVSGSLLLWGQMCVWMAQKHSGILGEALFCVERKILGNIASSVASELEFCPDYQEESSRRALNPLMAETVNWL